MAAIENLEIVVNVDISDAISDLQALQEELEDVANEIRSVRRIGARGFEVEGHVESISDDLARVQTEIRAFEMAHGNIDIGTNVHGDIPTPGGGGTGGGGGANEAFSRPFMSPGSIAASRMDNISSGMGSMFGPEREPDSRFRRVIQSLGDQFNDLRESAGNFDLRMSDMHNMLARLIPLLLVFIGAIPAVVGALWTLAAAAAAAGASMLAIAGFGALGLAMEDGEFQAENLQEAARQARDDFLDAFAPLAERLQPVFEDGLAGLSRFFDAVADEGDALVALTDEARAFGGFLIDFVPDALRTLAALVNSMSDIFGDFGSFLQANFSNIVRTMVELTAQAVPIIAHLGMVIGSMIPAVMRLSMGFLQMVNILMTGVQIISNLLSYMGLSTRMIGLLTAMTLTAVTAWTLFNSALISTAVGGLAAVGAKILAQIGTLTGYSVAAKLATFSTWNLYRALAAIIGLTGIGIALVGLSYGASRVAEHFNILGANIDDAASSLQDFQSIQEGMSGSGFGGSGDNPYGYDPEDPDMSPGSSGGVTVFNVESSGDPAEDRSNMEYADWVSGRTTGG